MNHGSQHQKRDTPLPRITFCTIVLNGEPFTRYHFRALYPYAHELIYVEGACPNARGNDRGDGHSSDGTLEMLQTLKQQEDPENKLTIVVAEEEGLSNGFWPEEKDQMMEAALHRATGDWVWMVDIDEFYLPATLDWVTQTLLAKNTVDTVSFPTLEFWGGMNYRWNGWRFKQLRHSTFHRLFRWAPGYRHCTHRPPTIVDQDGVDLRRKLWQQARPLESRGHFLFHYGYLLPLQVRNKCRYYSRMGWGYEQMTDWAENHYMHLRHPYRVDSNYTYPSWLERYAGPHPPEAMAMWVDLSTGKFGPDFAPRDPADIQKLLTSTRYVWGSFFLKYTPGLVVRSLHKSVQTLQKVIPPRWKNTLRKTVTPKDMQ